MQTITAFIFNLSKGGAQNVFVNVMNSFCDAGYSVKVVVQNLEDDIYRNDLNENILVESLDAKSAKDSLFKLISYVKHNEIECAWVFGPELAVNLYLARKINRKNFLIIGRSINTISVEFKYTDSIFRRLVTHTLIKVFFHKIDYVVAQSKNMGNDLVKNYHFDKDRVKVVKNAMSPTFAMEMMNAEEVIKDNYILYVGRLEKQKGLKLLLDSFSKLSNRNVRLILAGDGAERDKLIKYSEELGIKSRVEFIGHIKNPIHYYRRAKCVVLSSYYEGFPNVLVESIACGTPVVSFDCPSGPNEIIMEGINGHLVPNGDVEALRFAIDKALNEQWNPKDIKKTAERFSPSLIMDKYLKIMSELK